MEQVSLSDTVGHAPQRDGDRQEWFLLREDIDVGGTRHRAGTPIMRDGSQWFLHGGDQPIVCNLDGRLCRTEYGGLSLHVVTRSSDGGTSHRRVGSDESPEVIAVSRVISPPPPGHERVYLAFGDQFYPLDYFGW